MSEQKDQGEKKPLSLSKKLELKPQTSQVRQSFSHGRSKTVTVEVKRKRVLSGERPPAKEETAAKVSQEALQEAVGSLTEKEKDARFKALQEAMRHEKDVRSPEPKIELQVGEVYSEEDLVGKKKEADIDTDSKGEEEKRVASVEETPFTPGPQPVKTQPQVKPHERHSGEDGEEREERKRREAEPKKLSLGTTRRESNRKKITNIDFAQALEGEGIEGTRVRSLSSIKRAREKERKRQLELENGEAKKIVREVVVPEAITVQELANRMAVQVRDVIKLLMKMGVMANANESIDTDTAELIVTDFGHTIKRVAESDVEEGAFDEVEDTLENLLPRAPVVTIMGHVDHGKTSLLDALRETDVAAKEAGGITQHIGAYQIQMQSGDKITFIDTPGHAAFTEMRSRGANVTDIVIIVVAADEGIKDQTIEAIHHAKAAQVPLIIAINKMDKPGANPDRVRQELLNHEVVVERLGGDVLDVEVSAKSRLNLDKLEEAILLQAEVLDLKANPERAAKGAIIESRLEKGHGTVATVLIQNGTLSVGDAFVAGAEWGRVRTLLNSHGRKIAKAGPSTPVEVVGCNGLPVAGDVFAVAKSEGQARDIAEFRTRRDKEAARIKSARGTMDNMFARISQGELKELPVLIKADVQGSLEAITTSLLKLSTSEVAVKILHSAVGGINETDIILAKASKALVVGFQVRANVQARELAQKENIEIQYYSVIYDLIEIVKNLLSGMLTPTLREKALGVAEIRKVFNITDAGKIAGCMVKEGLVKRGARARLLRDNIVIHTGGLKTLKRNKDEVREVKSGFECGMAFENYQDIREGDLIECFEMESIERTL